MTIQYRILTTTVFITFPTLVFPLTADSRGGKRRRRQRDKAVREGLQDAANDFRIKCTSSN